MPKNAEAEVMQQEPIDVEQTKVMVFLPKPAPGEEDCVFVSNGRENVTVKKGMPVEVPYWVAIRLRQASDAEDEAARYERWSEEMAQRA